MIWQTRLKTIKQGISRNLIDKLKKRALQAKRRALLPYYLWFLYNTVGFLNLLVIQPGKDKRWTQYYRCSGNDYWRFGIVYSSKR